MISNMAKGLVIDKKTNKKTCNINVESNEYYKKCGYRSDKDFKKRHTWKVKKEGKDKYVSVFAKDKGRSGSENKYELPPPVDSELYFGSILLVMHDEKDEYNKDDLVDMTEEDWDKFYDKLYGGFEDLGEEDSFSSEEEIPPELMTKEGYSKEDGFIVDDDEGEDEEYVPESEEEEYVGEEEDDEDEEEEDSYEDSYDEDEESDLASELEEEEFTDTD